MPEKNNPQNLPKLAVWKFASCDGCQLSLLDCEDELLDLTNIIQIANFPEATREVLPGPYDLSLVEGSITTPDDLDKIKYIREQSKFLITIGACATSGGIQALRNYANIDQFVNMVYPSAEYINTLATSTPIAKHVKVDFELHGCPINKYQLLDIIKSFVYKTKNNIKSISVCQECKLKHNICVTVAHGIPCMGPVTHAGCGALCPSYNRGCYGCFGSKENPNPLSLCEWWQKKLNISNDKIKQNLRNFNCADPNFSEPSKKYD